MTNEGHTPYTDDAVAATVAAIAARAAAAAAGDGARAASFAEARDADGDPATRRRAQMAALKNAEIDLSFFVADCAQALRFDPDQIELRFRTLTAAVLTLARLRKLQTDDAADSAGGGFIAQAALGSPPLASSARGGGPTGEGEREIGAGDIHQPPPAAASAMRDPLHDDRSFAPPRSPPAPPQRGGEEGRAEVGVGASNAASPLPLAPSARGGRGGELRLSPLSAVGASHAEQITIVGTRDAAPPLPPLQEEGGSPRGESGALTPGASAASDLGADHDAGIFDPEIDERLAPHVVAATLEDHGLRDLAPALLPLLASAEGAPTGSAFPAAIIAAPGPALSLRQRIVREQIGRAALAAGLVRAPVKFNMQHELPQRRPELRDKNPRADDLRK